MNALRRYKYTYKLQSRQQKIGISGFFTNFKYPFIKFVKKCHFLIFKILKIRIFDQWVILQKK